MKEESLLKNEHGSVLIIGLVILMLLTLLGISMTRTSEVEIQIAGNDRIYKQNLYIAEALAMEAAQSLNNIVPDPQSIPPNWLETVPNTVTDDDIRNWNATASDLADLSAPTMQSYLPDPQDANADIHYFALYEGIDPESSLDMTESNVHVYRVFGRVQRHKGLAVVEVGYKRAF